jgi:hypothetical protein
MGAVTPARLPRMGVPARRNSRMARGTPLQDVRSSACRPSSHFCHSRPAKASSSVRRSHEGPCVIVIVRSLPHIASHRIASHRIASHRIASHRIASHEAA